MQANLGLMFEKSHFLFSLTTWERGKTACERLGRQTSTRTKTRSSKNSFRGHDISRPTPWASLSVPHILLGLVNLVRPNIYHWNCNCSANPTCLTSRINFCKINKSLRPKISFPSKDKQKQQNFGWKAVISMSTRDFHIMAATKLMQACIAVVACTCNTAWRSPQKPRSFWSAPRIANSILVWHRKSATDTFPRHSVHAQNQV